GLIEDEHVRVFRDEWTGDVAETRKGGLTVLLDLRHRRRNEVDDECPLHAVVVDAAADDIACASRSLHEPYVTALPSRQQPGGHRPLIVVPAAGFASDGRRADQASDD